MLREARSTCKSDLCSQQPQEFCTFETSSHLTSPAFDRLEHLIPQMLYFLLSGLIFESCTFPSAEANCADLTRFITSELSAFPLSRRWHWSRWHSRGDLANNQKSCPPASFFHCCSAMPLHHSSCLIDYLLLPLPPFQSRCLGNALPHPRSESSCLCPWMCALACHISKMPVVQMSAAPQEIEARLYQFSFLFIHVCVLTWDLLLLALKMLNRLNQEQIPGETWC